MELISSLTRIALEMAYECCMIDWHLDSDPPDIYSGEMEIKYVPGWREVLGDYHVILNGDLYCQISASTMQCWTATDLRPYRSEGILPYER